MAHHHHHQQQQEDFRKGPWTEEEDFILLNIVNLFGDRRWDFVAKVSGLKVGGRHSIERTGKSCRLRWVNYLHPGLKRGKMSPQEERLVLELHAKWGNRWSKIARKIPGRTDNEIKNYWRTHMRKKAQERKRAATSPSNSITTPTQSSSSSSNPTVISSASGERSFYDTGGCSSEVETGKKKQEGGGGCSSMDEIWKDIDNLTPLHSGNVYCPQLASPMWEYYSEPLWRKMMDEEEDEDTKMVLPFNDQFLTDYEFGTESGMAPLTHG